ncbi:putative threonine aldolase [Papiliotrema laurentii]|uniref:Threonine aldolase n=1 Tax=Papiliotrema laurentii TaxID=5418 RepID=A0AAD9LA14_PAPLA|nr:putative threonine aldolase [Papiliotrema laurentii]
MTPRLPLTRQATRPLSHRYTTTTNTLAQSRRTMTGLLVKPEVTAEISGQANVDKFQAISRDFRSDTMTMPSDGMMLAAIKASRGDSVYEEDPDTAALEARIAKMTGKEDCLFAVSGTLTNQLAIRTHLKQPPHSVIVDWRAHVHKMEAGAIAMFSQGTTHQLVPSNGLHLTANDIKPHLVLGDNIHTAPTKLICLENTLSGIVFPQDEVVKIGELCRENDIALHLDGARIWNVGAKVVEERGLDPNSEANRTAVFTELLQPFDTASLCLSKGIGAPIGSALVGPKDFIKRAKWFRKAFGGGIRQAGFMTVSADYALTHHFPRLASTHALARRLADGLQGLGCEILAPVDTNMVFFNADRLGVPFEAIKARMEALPNPISIMFERLVIHHQITPAAVEDFIAVIRELRDEVRAGRGDEVAAEAEKLDGEQLEVEKSEGKLRKQAALGY